MDSLMSVMTDRMNLGVSIADAGLQSSWQTDLTCDLTGFFGLK